MTIHNQAEAIEAASSAVKAMDPEVVGVITLGEGRFVIALRWKAGELKEQAVKTSKYNPHWLKEYRDPPAIVDHVPRDWLDDAMEFIRLSLSPEQKEGNIREAVISYNKGTIKFLSEETVD
jgi:hypothetical protein